MNIKHLLKKIPGKKTPALCTTIRWSCRMLFLIALTMFANHASFVFSAAIEFERAANLFGEA
jgi:hypothetical protein